MISLNFFSDKFECIYDVYPIYTNLVVSHGCEICDTFFCIFHELFIHIPITENICDLIKNIVYIFFSFLSTKG